MNTKPVTTNTGGCSDVHASCEQWAKSGECDKNPFWMKPNCQKSCNWCGKTVADVPVQTLSTGSTLNKQSTTGIQTTGIQTTGIQTTGTQTNVQPTGTHHHDHTTHTNGTSNMPTHHHTHDHHTTGQQQTIGATTTDDDSSEETDCADTNQLCAFWASMGECTKNAAYMTTNCEKSCSAC
jgi:hypothetical protein